MNLLHLSLARVGNHRKVPRVPTNDERMRAYRAATPAQFGNHHFTPARSMTGPLPPGAGVAGIYDPNPPTPEEVAEAGAWKYGLND